MKRTKIPPAVLEDEDALEVISVWIAGGRTRVSMNTGWSRDEVDGPREREDAWGFMLAELAVHMANAVAQDTGYPRDLMLKRIRERFDRELDEVGVSVSGQITEGDGSP